MITLNPESHIHLVGVGGAGLSAIALFLLEEGYQVSGSDRQMSVSAKELLASGVNVIIGHDPANVDGADLVIRSSAIPEDNLEIRHAMEIGIPVLKRGEFLGMLIADRRSIAVAGSHGKTTTTAMIAWLLTQLGEDPSYIIGGVSKNLGNNAHAGQGRDFVIEADEYDRMFLGLNPWIAVVTNVEHDHPDCYPTEEDFHQVFREFVGCIIPDGVLIYCGDDPGAAQLVNQVNGNRLKLISYGLFSNSGGSQMDYLGVNIHPKESGSYEFTVIHSGSPTARVALHIPGRHNVYNALAAMAVADYHGLNLSMAAEALGEFNGTGRRFEVRAETKGITIIDDYAHHPTEIKATLSAARQRYPDREIWVVWQPHTYSRTRLLKDNFAAAFTDADHVLVTEIYAARESNPGDISSVQVVEAMSHPDVTFTPSFDRAVNILLSRLKSGHVLLVLSAGDADEISIRVMDALLRQGSTQHVH